MHLQFIISPSSVVALKHDTSLALGDDRLERGQRFLAMRPERIALLAFLVSSLVRSERVLCTCPSQTPELHDAQDVHVIGYVYKTDLTTSQV